MAARMAAGPAAVVGPQEWLVTAGPFTTMASARETAESMEGRRWKTNRQNPGDNKRRAGYICNFHKECEREMRVVRRNGEFFIEFKGEHGETLSERKRKNSTLTWDEEGEVAKAITLGNKPGQIRVAMTLAKSNELRQNHMDPLEHKNESGGLIGVQTAPHMLIQSHIHIYRCIMSRMCMYAHIHVYMHVYMNVYICMIHIHVCNRISCLYIYPHTCICMRLSHTYDIRIHTDCIYDRHTVSQAYPGWTRSNKERRPCSGQSVAPSVSRSPPPWHSTNSVFQTPCQHWTSCNWRRWGQGHQHLLHPH